MIPYHGLVDSSYAVMADAGSEFISESSRLVESRLCRRLCRAGNRSAATHSRPPQLPYPRGYLINK